MFTPVPFEALIRLMSDSEFKKSVIMLAIWFSRRYFLGAHNRVRPQAAIVGTSPLSGLNDRKKGSTCWACINRSFGSLRGTVWAEG